MRESPEISLSFLKAVVRDATVSFLGMEGTRALLEEIISSAGTATWPENPQGSDHKISAFRSVSAAIADSELGAARVPLFQRYIETTGHEIHAVCAGIHAIGGSDLGELEQAALLRLMLNSSPSVKDQHGHLPWMMSLVVEEARLGDAFIPLFEDALNALDARYADDREGSEWLQPSDLEKVTTSLAKAGLREKGLPLFQRLMERAYRLAVPNFRMQLVRHITEKKREAIPDGPVGQFDDLDEHRKQMDHVARAILYYEAWWGEMLAGLEGGNTETVRLTNIFLANGAFAKSLVEAEIGEAGLPLWERLVEQAEAEVESHTRRRVWFDNAFRLSTAVKGTQAAQLFRRLERIAGDGISSFEISQFARGYHRIGAQTDALRLARVSFERARSERHRFSEWEQELLSEIGGPSFEKALWSEWEARRSTQTPRGRIRRSK